MFKRKGNSEIIRKGRVKENSKKDLIVITPSELKFTYLSTNMKKQEKKVQITNYSSKSCPLLISPPESRYFKITSKTLKEWLNPGSSFILNITFMPDDIRNYHDSIRIQEFEKKTFILKISATPKCEINYPKNVNFGTVPLGSIVRYQIPIYSDKSKKISFAVFPLSEIELNVNCRPLWGTLNPRQDPVIVNIEYQALRYITANFRIQLFIPEICKSPFLINFVAYTYPGLEREKLEKLIEPIQNQEESKKNITNGLLIKLDKKITPPTIIKTLTKKKEKIEEYDEAQLMRKLKKIPPNTLHGVNFIMNNRLNKSHDQFELKGPLNLFPIDAMTQKMKSQNNFLTKTEKLWTLNERVKNNQKTKLGLKFSNSYRENLVFILEERKRHLSEYKNKMISTSNAELLQRDKVVKIRQRILRSSTENFENTTFYELNCDWNLKYSIIASFIQAARRVILINRLKRVLIILKKLTPEIVAKIEKLILKEQKTLKYKY